jgi:cytochrome c2
MRHLARIVVAVVAGALALLAPAGPARAEGDVDDFRANCASCHTIGGGRLVGPDLKNVTTPGRAPSRAWLIEFVTDPTSKIQGGDPYAQKLLAEARNVLMAPVAGMNAKRAEGLLKLIEAESKLEKSQFATVGISDRPFTAADVARGREIFLGTQRLKGTGAACMSCHSAGDTGGLGGGRLGPDLADVFGRLGGRKALGAWFMAPPTATMKPLFGRTLDPETEILPVVAFLKDTADRHASPNVTAQRLTFVFVAAAGAAALLVLMDLAWKRRFRGVRAAMVAGPGKGRAVPRRAAGTEVLA